MDIKETKITIGALTNGYSDSGESGVTGYGGKLDIRPPYQREFVYKGKQKDDVIRSVLAGFPLNVMYWATRPDGTYEVLDGQQRTISISEYINGDFSIDGLYYSNQPDDVQECIKGYELTVYVCDGDTSEKLEWFKIVNIPGEKLFDQELLNATFHGPWLADAKRYFSRRQCVAQNLGGAYVKGDPIRQELLEKAIKWVSGGNIKDYMGIHQHDDDADELWSHFKKVIAWVEATFPKKRAIMKDVDWGSVYVEHSSAAHDPTKLETEIKRLLSLEDSSRKNPIQKLSGIYLYVLDGDEQHLNLRTFNKAQKTAAYEKQDGKCAFCGKGFEFGQMHGDHIKPWKDGGLTDDGNLQMLCQPCNQRKGTQ